MNPTTSSASAATRSTGRQAALIAVLGSLTAIGPLSIDMYVPGFPEIASELHVGEAGVQLSMTAMLVGMAVGQILIGPISDGLGRRRLLIGGCVGFVVFALACAAAPNIEILLLARLLQGISGAAGVVLARAVITDRFRGRDIPKYFALLSQILGIAPVVAPLVGGAVLTFANWRVVFVVLSGLGVLLLAGVVAKVPETLPAERRNPHGLAGTFRTAGGLLRHRGFVGFALVLGLSAASLFAYIGGSSFVFEDLHHVSPAIYSVIFAVNAIGMLIASTTFGMLARTMRLNTLLAIAVAITAAGALLDLILTLTLGDTLVGSWVSLFIGMAGVGMLFPATLSLGQGVGRHAPGAASAILGGAQFAFGAVGAPLVGSIHAAGSLPMVFVMVGAVSLAVLATIFLVQPRRGHGEPEPVTVAVHPGTTQPDPALDHR